MLGVLVKGNLDDGRGKARVNLFRHKHEVESGRTSSVGMEIMGFDTLGNVVASNVPGRKLSWEEIGNRSVFASTLSYMPELIDEGESYQFHRSGRTRTVFADDSFRPTQ